MTEIMYFAYGSNMLPERIKRRCSSATEVGVAYSKGFQIAFTKRSKDGSGKATLIKSEDLENLVYGVIFKIDSGQINRLDSLEGKGYGYERLENFLVTPLGDEKTIETNTYIASPQYLDKTLLPYNWYKALVCCGAKHNNFPENYVEYLEGFASKQDPDKTRKERLEAYNIIKN